MRREACLLGLVLLQPSTALNHPFQPENRQSRRAICHSAATTLLFARAPDATAKKKPEPPKCYDAKFNEFPCNTAIGDTLTTTAEDVPEAWRSGGGAPVANPDMVTTTYDGQEVQPGSAMKNVPLKTYIPTNENAAQRSSASNEAAAPTKAKNVRPGAIDVNNMVAVEFSVYPGLYPTIAGKLVKRGPFKTIKDMYAALDTDAERSSLKAFEKGIVVVPRDADVFQYKTAGFYFKGKGGDNKVNSEFRNEEIKRLQGERKQPQGSL
jgi:hypothetical protein